MFNKVFFYYLLSLCVSIGCIAALRSEQDPKAVCKSIVDKDTKVLTDLFKKHIDSISDSFLSKFEKHKNYLF